MLVGAAPLARGQTATQRVTFQVTAVNRLAIDGAPQPIAITTATPGAAPTPVSAAGGTYAITTNEANRKITAAIDADMPAGVTLEIALAAPDDATSAGSVPLGTGGADVVTGIHPTAASALPITYRLSATVAALMPAPESRTVTLTILAAP